MLRDTPKQTGNHRTSVCNEDDRSIDSLYHDVMTWKSCLQTVYPKKYAHGFVVLCFVVVMLSFIMNSHEVFIHIHQGCFADTGAIVRLPQCQWSKPDGYGKISQCITTTMHSKAKTVCIFLGIYCNWTFACRSPQNSHHEGPVMWTFAYISFFKECVRNMNYIWVNVNNNFSHPWGDFPVTFHSWKCLIRDQNRAPDMNDNRANQYKPYAYFTGYTM